LRRQVTRRIQYLLFSFFYWAFSLPLLKRTQKGDVIIGNETASMLQNISKALPSSVSVNFEPNRFYEFNYTYQIYTSNKLSRLKNDLLSGCLLGFLASRHERFIYIGEAGFLIDNKDGRQHEFSLLKKKNKKLICYFLGSEIRSFKLLQEYAEEKEIDVITTYQSISQPGINSEKKENNRKRLGETADKYADLIFNAEVDQMAYIKRKTFPLIYFMDDELFNNSLSKFVNLTEIIILHAPSSPLIKGTPLVRAAIKNLRTEGYRFKYVELLNTPHSQMLRELRSAHIVLNQFYAFLPGVFGIEAIANSCVLLTSADRNIEPSLDEGANDAWIVTPYWRIYDNLKLLLDNKHLMVKQAEAGYQWADRNCRYSTGVKKLYRIINN